MRPAYYDILQRIAEPPQWFDWNGVPRYGRFHPRHSPSLFADEVVLFEIGCQGCRRILRVEANFSVMDPASAGLPSLRESIRKKTLDYGDPPLHETPQHQACGDMSMNSIPLKVLQYWRRQKSLPFHWVREPRLEGLDIEGPWGATRCFQGRPNLVIGSRARAP